MSTMVIHFRLHTFLFISLLGLPGISTTRESGSEASSPRFPVLREVDVVHNSSSGCSGMPFIKAPNFQFDILSPMDLELYEMCFLYKLI